MQVELSGKVMNGINKKVDGCEAARQKRTPPPSVVLRAQVKVAQEYGRLRARYYQNQVDDGQKAEHVVELVRPNAV